MPGCMLPVLGRLGSRRLASAMMASGCTPHVSSTGRTIPSCSSARAISRCSGYITWLPFFSASTWHCCNASWAFWVNLSRRNIGLPQKLRDRPAATAASACPYTCDVRRFDPLLGGLDLDLPRFGSLLLGERDGEHAILVPGIDLIGVERVGHGETAHEIAI